MSSPVSGDSLAAFFDRAEEAADAYVSDDMKRYAELVPDADEFTLLPPYGGPPDAT